MGSRRKRFLTGPIMRTLAIVEKLAEVAVASE
jgi:hypothetical protein